MSSNISAIFGAACAIAQMLSLWIKYRTKKISIQHLEDLKNECKDIEEQILQTRKLSEGAASVAMAARLCKLADRLRFELSLKRAELKHLSNSGAKN